MATQTQEDFLKLFQKIRNAAEEQGYRFDPPPPPLFEPLPALQAALRFLEQSSGEAASVILGPRWREHLAAQGQVPDPGTAAQFLGQVGGTLGQFAVGQALAGGALRGLGSIPGLQQAASRLPAPLQTYLARQAAAGALTGAATTGVQALADPESVGLRELGQNVAFLGAGSLGTGAARGAIAARAPGMHRLAEAALAGAAGGLAGTAATAPFAEDLSSLPTDALANAAALALFQAGMTILTPFQPTAAFIRAGRRAGEAVGRGAEGARTGRAQQVQAARKDFEDALNEMYHVARQARPDLPERMTPEIRAQFEAIFNRATASSPPRDVTPRSSPAAQIGTPGAPEPPATLRRISRFDLTRMPVEEQRLIRDLIVGRSHEELQRIGFVVSQTARDYLVSRFPADFEPLVSAWERAGVPNEVISRAVQRTDPESLRKRQRRLEAQGVVDIPMYQPGRWVRVRAGETDFSAAQRAFVDAGRPRDLLDLTKVEEGVPAAAPAPEREPAAPTPAVPPAEPEPAPAAQTAPPFSQAELPPPVDVEAVRRSLQDTGSARVDEYVIRIVPHPEASGRTLESYAVEWSAPDGTRSVRPTPPLTIEAAMDEAVRIADEFLAPPVEPPAQTETPPPAEPPRPPAAAPTAEIVEGDVVYGRDGRSYRVLDVSHPNRLAVVREQDGQEMFVPRAAVTKSPPAEVAAASPESEPTPIPAAPTEPVAAETPRVEPDDLTPEEQEALTWMSLSIMSPGGFDLEGHNIRIVQDRGSVVVQVTPPGGEPSLLPGRFDTAREAYQAARQYAANVFRQARGARRETGEQPIERPTELAATEPEPLPPFQPAATGAETTARTERGTPVTTQYAVVEAGDLITSHDTALQPDPRFPQELQPRDRTRAASEIQITRITGQLHPEWLGESPKASEGAPIVGPDGIVESGNARAIALKRLAEQEHPNMQRYREWLAENAERFGIERGAIERMQAPVLVRVRRSEVDRSQFVQEANEPAVAAMSATEQAAADARAMSTELMSRFVPSETGEFHTAANREFISGFVEQVVSPTERARLMRPDGGLSAEGLTRIRNAVFARAYGDPDVIMQLAEDPDSNVRNITGAMLNVAPRLAIIKDRIAEGSLHDLDLTEEIARAARKLSELRQAGQTVQSYLAQTTLFADDLTALAKAILEVFDKFSRSRKRLTEVLQAYADMVEAAGHPGQTTLFGETQAPTKETLLRAAVEEVDARYAGEVAGQTRMEVSEGGPERSRPDTEAVPGEEAPRTETRGLPESADERAAHERPRPGTDTPVITRKEAIDYIEREFLMPVREGRLRFRGSRGEFNLRTHVTRLRRAEDFRALTHEFGHFLSETMDLKPEQYPELQPMGAALYPDADVALQHEEGAAEFFYLYFSRPEEARAAAPTFYEDFEERIRREADLGAKIRQAQKLLTAQFNQTGTAAIKAAIVREDAKDRPFLTPIQRFYTAWIDDLHPIWLTMKYILGDEKLTSEWDVQVSQNPYILGRLARGRGAKANTFLTRAQISPTFERIGPSFQEILKPVSSRIEDFEAYLVAKRALELWERGINPGVKREDAATAVRELENPEFQKAQQELVAYQSNLIDHLVDAGVLNRQTADSFRELNQYYVPFYRYFGEETMSGGFAGSRLKWGNLPKPVKAIRGSTRSIMSPLQSIMRNTFAMIDIAERNRAARALVELADKAEGIGWLIEHVPTPMQPNKVVLEQLRKDLLAAGIPKDALSEADLDRLAVTFNPVNYARIKENKENILTVYRNGRPQFYQLHPELYRAMQFLDQPASNWLFRLLTAPTRMLRAGAVLNPEFALRNPARDQFAALMHRKYRFTPVIDPARAIFHMLKGQAVGGDELYDLWQAAGGAQSTLVSLNRDYLEKDLRKLLGERTPWEKAAAIIRSPLTALEFISAATEEATRLAQFRRGIEAEGRTPEGIRKAAYASREVSVDFQRAGSLGRQANQIKAFFNAAIQGVDQMARLWKKDPISYTLRAFLYITLPSVMLYLLNRDDPRYQELPRWRRDLYWVFLGEDGMTFVPKPFELGILFGTLPERILEFVMDEDPAAFREFEQTLFDTMLPVDPTNPVDWLPDAMVPIVEVWANRQAFTDRPIVPRSEEMLLPAAQYGPHTTETAKAVGAMTGISPRQIEHLVQGYGAGLGRQALRFVDRLAGVQSLAPVLRPFGGDPFVSAVSLNEFYEELDQLERLQRTANEMRKRGFASQIPVNEWRLRQLRRTRDNLASLRRMSRTVLEDPRLSVEEKRRITDSINLRMVNLARTALGKPPIAVQQPSGT